MTLGERLRLRRNAGSIKPAAAASPAPAPYSVPVTVPAPSPPDPSDAEVEKLLNELREAVRRAGVQRDDPMMPLLTALAHAIRFLGERTSRSDRIAQETSRQTIDTLLQGRRTADAETARFQAGLASTEADIIQRVGAAIARSADAALTRRVRVFDRNTALSAAATLFVTAAVCLGGGYWWGYHAAADDIHQTELGLRAAFDDGPATARMWLNLMRWNSLADALAHCHDPTTSTIEDGRRGCALPFWIEPAPTRAPNVQR